MKRVLVVEDEKCISEIICLALKSKGFEVLVANNGDDALQIGNQDRELIDVLFCDLVVPGAEGAEVVRTLREAHPHIRVVIMTGHSMEEVARYGIPGRFCVLEKPFSICKVVECVTCLEEVQSCDSAGEGRRIDARTSCDTKVGMPGGRLRHRA